MTLKAHRRAQCGDTQSDVLTRSPTGAKCRNGDHGRASSGKGDKLGMCESSLGQAANNRDTVDSQCGDTVGKQWELADVRFLDSPPWNSNVHVKAHSNEEHEHTGNVADLFNEHSR